MAKIKKISPRKRKWEDVFEEFIMFKKAEGISPRTVYDYEKRVKGFLLEYPKCWSNYDNLRTSVIKHLASFVDKAPATYNLPLSYLRCFFNWCVREGILAENPTNDIKKKKDTGRARDIDSESLIRLLEVPKRDTYTGVRDYALILLQLDTGIRPGEALKLLPGHINLRSMEVVIPSGAAKTRVSRTVCVCHQTLKAIRILLDCRPIEWKDDVPVFCSQDGTLLRESSWSRKLKRYGDKIGIYVTPYMLRHSSAIMYLRNGGHVLSLQRALGHSNLSMTKRYVNLTHDDLREQHAIASPIASLIPTKTRVRNLHRK